MQVEAAIGAQDVVRFCGGLRAVLGAARLPLLKALPCPVAGEAAASSDKSQILLQGARGASAAVVVVGLEASRSIPDQVGGSQVPPEQAGIACDQQESVAGGVSPQGRGFSHKDEVGSVRTPFQQERSAEELTQAQCT